MSEWKAVCTGRYWYAVERINDGAVRFFARCDKKEMVDQIVREHNVHDALMGLAKSWRDHVGTELAVRKCKYQYRPNEWQAKMINWAQEEHTKANAVLAQAEGRE